MSEDAIVRTVRKQSLKEADDQRRLVREWLSRPVADRFSAVEFLRRQYYGDYSERLQRVFSVTQR